MIIHVIVVRVDGSPWIADAMDDCQLDSYPSIWDEMVQKAKKIGEIRILKVRVPDDALEKTFETPPIDGRIV